MMPTFKQKNVIKSYKLRLQDKLRQVTEETENATSFLNNCVAEFKNRVEHILEIKDEKCLSLYRKLTKDLESYSEKIFILQASLEQLSEEETDSSEDDSSEKAVTDLPRPLPAKSSENERVSHDGLLKEDTSNERFSDQDVNCQREALQNINVESLPLEDLNFKSECSSLHRENVFAKRYSDENLSLPSHPERNVNVLQFSDRNLKYSCNNEIYDGGSITEDDFYSLHSDNNIQYINNVLSNLPLDKQRKTEPDCPSIASFSQSSCYRSISSTLSSHKENENTIPFKTYLQYSLDPSKEVRVIHPVEFEISTKFSAILSYIIDPSDFWLQIENSYTSKLRFPRSEYAHFSSLTSIKVGQFCLAPFKSDPFYTRAKSFANATSAKELVKVQFIDHGSIREVSLSELRPLPDFAYEIPAQAINCYLYGIAPTDDSWSKESIDRFKEFQASGVETEIKSKDYVYGVQLVQLLECEFSDYSLDIAESFCLDGLAISLNESSSHSTHQLEASAAPTQLCDKTDSTLDVSGTYDVTAATSNDSGVSLTSFHKSSQIACKSNIFDKISHVYAPFSPFKSDAILCDKIIDSNSYTRIPDLISFESEELIKNTSDEIKALANSDAPYCPICRNENFCFHLKVPPPSLLFVVKNMVVVMISHIVSPDEFYVNMAMENIGTLDELREQMTTTYETEKIASLNLNNLSENMYCAGFYDADNCWYRVKILRISAKDIENNEVLGQFIDYGNTSTIKCSKLRPLSTEFSKHPCFAVKCALAGVRPIGERLLPGETPSWPDEAIKIFKGLTSPFDDKFFTAQICNELGSDQSDTYKVLLWDVDDSHDLLINASLADHKVAILDCSALQSSSTTQKTRKPSVSTWDPMLEDYVDCQNSYAVDDEDIEVATSGYRARDEEYTCKYFSMRGYCPRGVNCPYEHLPMLDSGVTRDQEEVYCMDSALVNSDDVKNFLVQVSAVYSPSIFYVVLPFGCKNVDEIDFLASSGEPWSKVVNSDAAALFHAMHEHYSNAPFQENTAIALSCGAIVAAKRRYDEKWHRGRIVDVEDIHKPVKVFFVDSGDHDKVSRKQVRTILQQFLHTPFQAVQCSIHGIEPDGIGSENGKWSKQAVNFFTHAVHKHTLLAEIIQRFDQAFHVSLRKTTKEDHRTIADNLVSAGYAKYSKSNEKKAVVKKDIVYVPG